MEQYRKEQPKSNLEQTKEDVWGVKYNVFIDICKNKQTVLDIYFSQNLSYTTVYSFFLWEAQ